MILYEQSLIKKLREHCDNAQSRIWVASPFIGNEADIERIIGNRWQLPEVDCRILTDAEAGFMREDTFNAFKDAGVEIRSLLSLHAKIYIVDNWALITSANLTGTAFSKRFEIGTTIEDELEDVIKCFNKWWVDANVVTIFKKPQEITVQSYEEGKPFKFKETAKLPPRPLPHVDIKTQALDDLLEWYIETWDIYHVKAAQKGRPDTIENTHEGYKWMAFEQAQKDFANGMPTMDVLCKQNSCLDKAGNLLKGSMYYPRRMVIKLSSVYPVEVRSCFLDLFDETQPLVSRITGFLDSMKTLTDKANAKYPGLFSSKEPSSMQSIRSISVYLAMMYPEKYYLYKSGVYDDFLQCANINAIDLGFKKEEKLVKYYTFCNRLCSEIKKKDLLLKKCEKTFGVNNYNLHLLTQDFMYCVAYYYNS